MNTSSNRQILPNYTPTKTKTRERKKNITNTTTTRRQKNTTLKKRGEKKSRDNFKKSRINILF